MAQIVIGGADEFDAMVFGRPHPGTQQFLASQIERPTSILTEAGRRFMEKARDLYERISGSYALRVARAAGRQVRSLWQTDEIRPLTTIAELQTAPLTMQRWIMANPELRRAYHRQQCDGYSSTYVDIFPNDIGESHYDYRRAVNGLVMMDEETGDWEATTYMEELLPEDEELLLEDQVDIQISWAHAVSALRAKGPDPTSIWDKDL